MDRDEHYIFPPRTSPRVALEEAPAEIVAGGRIRLGRFKAPPRRMNFDAAALFARSIRRPFGPLLVQWVGAGMAHPEWYFGLILVDAKLASLGVFYGYHRQTGAYFSHDVPALRGNARVAETPWASTTTFRSRGFSAEIDHQLEGGSHQVTIDIAAGRLKPAVKGRLVWHEDLSKTQPLVLLSPIEGGGFLYNHKAQMPIEGSLLIGRDEVRFDPRRDLANLDDLKLQPTGRELSYRWFNCGGFDRQGRVVGFDLAHTPQKPDSFWEENCLWVGPALSMCPSVSFDVDLRDLMKPWRARDAEGKIDVTFTPEGGKTVKLGPVGQYHQKCGRFNGRIVDAAGEEHLVRDFFGCAEAAEVLT